MEETENPELDGKVNTVNGGTGAAVTQIVAEQASSMPHWQYIAILVAVEILGLVAGAIVLWPRNAH